MASVSLFWQPSLGYAAGQSQAFTSLRLSLFISATIDAFRVTRIKTRRREEDAGADGRWRPPPFIRWPPGALQRDLRRESGTPPPSFQRTRSRTLRCFEWRPG
ncbi:hypothetical protein PI124_g10325 [Phytophthora idaei]|nr:hypothetical protein PI124_g10325 [Phytophthora idaei]